MSCIAVDGGYVMISSLNLVYARQQLNITELVHSLPVN